MRNTFGRCVGWGLLFALFIIIIGSLFWRRDSYSPFSSDNPLSVLDSYSPYSKDLPLAALDRCDYSPGNSQTCLNSIGTKESCIQCSLKNGDTFIRLTAGDLNKYLSRELYPGAYPVQFVNRQGEFVNIVRYNDIQCKYDQELIVQGESVIPCVINNVLDAFLPSDSLTHYIRAGLHEGMLALNAVPYP